VKYHLQMYDAGVLLLERAIHLGVSSPDAMQFFQRCCEAAFGAEQARRYISIQCNRTPNNPLFWYGLALSSWTLGDPSLVYDPLDHALRISPSESRFRNAKIGAETAFDPSSRQLVQLDSAIRQANRQFDLESWCFLEMAKIGLLQVLGRYREAGEITVYLNRECSKFGIKRWQGWSCMKLAEQSSARGDINASIPWATLALETAIAANDIQLQFSALSHLSIGETERGEFHKALRAAVTHFKLGELTKQSNEVLEGLLDIGQVMVFMDAPVSGRYFLTAALAILPRASATIYQVVKLRALLAMAGERVGDLEEAESQLSLALKLVDGSKVWSPTKGILLDHLARVAAARGETEEARKFYSRERLIGILAHEQRLLIQSEIGLGELLLQEGNPKQALGILRIANIKARASGLYEDRIRALKALSQISVVSGNRKAALSYTKEIMGFRFNPGSIFRATQFKDARRGDVENCLQLLLEMGKTEKALSVVLEYQRARFQDPFQLALQKGHQDSKRPFPERSAILASELRGLYDSLANQNSHRGFVDAEAHELELRIEILLKEAEFSEARYYGSDSNHRVDSSDLKPLNLPEIKRLLSERCELAVVYFIGHSSSWAFAICEDQIRVFNLKTDERGIAALIKGLSPVVAEANSHAASWGRLLGGFDSCTTSVLFRTLLKQLTPLIERSTSVLIIPDDPIRNLPFEVLRDSSIEKKPGAGQQSYPLLIRPTRYSLFLDSSQIRRSEPLSLQRITLLKGTDSHETSERPSVEEGLGEFESGGFVPSLPGAEDECSTLAIMFDGLSDTQAPSSENVFITDKSSSVLHSASHGSWDEEFPLGSSMEFLQPNGSVFHLRVSDCDAFFSNSPLVFLSGCSTARWSHEQSTYGFPQIVTTSGTRAIIGTLWPVDDRISRLLVISFYEHLRRGVSVGESLRRAKVELIESGRGDPYSWAGFVLIGEDLTFKPQRESSVSQENWGWVLLSLIGGAMLFKMGSRWKHQS
jgi:CHAT domain-containing protein/tetratricopeptide (TPR) repeat protein